MLASSCLFGCADSSSEKMPSGVGHPLPMPKPGSESEITADIKNKDDAVEQPKDATENSDNETKIDTQDNTEISRVPDDEVLKTSGEPENEPTSENTDDYEWNLILVNPWNYLPDDFEVKMTTLKGGHKIDERAYPDLQKMMDDMRAEGLSPYICSSYRTVSYQQGLYDKQVRKQKAKGLSDEEARTEAAKWVAIPGTSEHHTGLALDIVASDYIVLDETQEKEPEQQWLLQNSWKYGFILRYPNDKTDITGIYYEPWHYRYVGKEAAAEIYSSGLTLEEYIQGRN